ncbi:alpha/beta fold hydrolase [Corallococcus macrosporus]|uniref:Putative 1H-3-hydroxy-4-oxoquinaldine 2,4-dioxygenase n=1 Tax=Myxococcus fulvus (strain ATCC BAA-855 / HW-1) TaxID=483219 RepID=F8CHW8_MYXFH|nr:alpha/beta hydrolase [Corallococcus macrosporus]AEI68801.1 putative 1H-3-hydroxy-4-oxoquinaldine 2,4-dioxygenase [Corallococcus macrosporus]
MPEVHTRGGARIRYDDVGQGEPALLFLPGWCTTRASFQKLLPRCSAFRRVLSVDLRGHGESEGGGSDFDSTTVLEDLLALVEASGARHIVPVAMSHAGWWALDLRRALGPTRVPRMVLLDWIATEPTPTFLHAVRGLQTERWSEVRDTLLQGWLKGLDDASIRRFVRDDMGAFDEAMWARAGREIEAAYAREGSPLHALAALEPMPLTMHLYARPESHDYLAAQVDFGVEHPGFHVLKLPATSHFPALEVPDMVAAGIEALVSAREVPIHAGAVPA